MISYSIQEVKMPGRSTKEIPDRATIYTKPEPRKEKLAWLMHHYNVESMSEAIFMAIDEVVTRKKKHQKGRLKKALHQTHGVWANDKKVEEAFAEAGKMTSKWRVQPS
jgi:hypothetical protein